MKRDWFKVNGELDPSLLSFDEYQRMRMIGDLINRFRKEGLRILDVGGGVGNFVYFVKGHEVEVADRRTTEIDGLSLPYEERGFDVVVSIDTLEHVAGEDRERFLDELIRVARYRVYLGVPTKEAEETERFIHTLTKDPWLEDHIRYGLPTREEIEGYLKKRGLSYNLYPNGYLGSWFAMLLVRHFGPKDFYPLINRFYNQNFYSHDHNLPTYRVIFEIIKDV